MPAGVPVRTRTGVPVAWVSPVSGGPDRAVGARVVLGRGARRRSSSGTSAHVTHGVSPAGSASPRVRVDSAGGAAVSGGRRPRCPRTPLTAPSRPAVPGRRPRPAAAAGATVARVARRTAARAGRCGPDPARCRDAAGPAADRGLAQRGRAPAPPRTPTRRRPGRCPPRRRARPVAADPAGPGPAASRPGSSGSEQDARQRDAVEGSVGGGSAGASGEPALDPALVLDRPAARRAVQHVLPGPVGCVSRRAGRRRARSPRPPGDHRASMSGHLGREPAAAWLERAGVAGPARRRRAVGERLAQHGAAAVDAGADGAELDARGRRRSPRSVRPSMSQSTTAARKSGGSAASAASHVVVEERRRAPGAGAGSRPASRSSASSASASKRIRALRRAWSRNRFVVIRCSQPSNVPGV